MSDLLQRSGISFRRWWPVIHRAGLYFCIAAIPDFLKEVSTLWRSGHWAPIQVNVLGAVSGTWSGLVAIRAFVDSFVQKHKEELKHDEETRFFAQSKPTT